MCLQINVINLSESYIFVHQTQFAHCALLVILKILSPLISILNAVSTLHPTNQQDLSGLIASPCLHSVIGTNVLCRFCHVFGMKI